MPGSLVISGGLDKRCQVGDVRWSGSVSPWESNQGYLKVWCMSRY